MSDWSDSDDIIGQIAVERLQQAGKIHDRWSGEIASFEDGQWRDYASRSNCGQRNAADREHNFIAGLVLELALCVGVLHLGGTNDRVSESGNRCVHEHANLRGGRRRRRRWWRWHLIAVVIAGRG